MLAAFKRRIAGELNESKGIDQVCVSKNGEFLVRSMRLVVGRFLPSVHDLFEVESKNDHRPVVLRLKIPES